MSEKTSAERYRELIASQRKGKEIETVDVTAPSGFVFKFAKPSKYAMLFSTNELPSFASAASGRKAPQTLDKLTPNQSTEMMRAAFTIRDRVCELSIDPKIVIGTATPGTNELSASNGDISDDDLTYLFEWVAAGGDAGLMLGKFRRGQQSNALASASRPKQRHAPVSSAIN